MPWLWRGERDRRWLWYCRKSRERWPDRLPAGAVGACFTALGPAEVVAELAAKSPRLALAAPAQALTHKSPDAQDGVRSSNLFDDAGDKVKCLRVPEVRMCPDHWLIGLKHERRIHICDVHDECVVGIGDARI